MTTKKDVYVISRVTQETKAAFYKKCKSSNIKPSDKIRELIEKFLGK